jgi:DNA-binding NarL/FixJ family response regulator
MPNARRQVQLYLVDDQAIMRAALRSRLKEYDDFTVVGDHGDPREAINQIANLKPDVILLDIAMRGLSGIDAIAQILKVHPKARILMLTQHEGESFVQQALEAGAHGYLSKNSDPEELRLGIEALARGESYVSSKVVGALVRGDGDGPAKTRLAALTPREREVFQLLALGRSNKEVAFKLGISPGTVKKHRENLQAKLDCHSAAELARMAMREGLMEG